MCCKKSTCKLNMRLGHTLKNIVMKKRAHKTSSENRMKPNQLAVWKTPKIVEIRRNPTTKLRIRSWGRFLSSRMWLLCYEIVSSFPIFICFFFPSSFCWRVRIYIYIYKCIFFVSGLSHSPFISVAVRDYAI